MLNKKILYTVIIGLATTFVAPALSASAAPSTSVTSTQTGWVQNGSDWYYYVNGEKQVGWIHPSDYYYMNKDGVMQTGWVKVDSKWYYLDKSGAMLTGWNEINGEWYFLDNSGAMVTGWYHDTNKYNAWFYFNTTLDEGTEGAMVTGWYHDTNKYNGWFYFNKKEDAGTTGAMLANTRTPDGYYVGESGAWDGADALNGQAIVNEAQKYLGTPYNANPNAPYSFDCSRFTQYVYQQVTGRDISRTTYTQILEGTPVSRENLQVGDLVFPSDHHVGIYVGDGKIIHAPQTGDVVKVSPIWSFYAARRIL